MPRSSHLSLSFLPRPSRSTFPSSFISLLAVCLCFSATCRCNDDAQSPSTALSSASNPSASQSAKTLPAKSSRLNQPLWKHALNGDPLDLCRLAAIEGAVGLLEALEDSGEIASTALHALPCADDAELALKPLTERAVAQANHDNADALGLRPLLEVILEIAGQPSLPREPLDSEGVQNAASQILTLSQRHDLDAAVRALAISAARALATKGYLDPATIPTDLDQDSEQ